MGVDISQYRATVGSFLSRVSTMGPKARERRRKNRQDSMWAEWLAWESIRSESNIIWLGILNIIIYLTIPMSMMSLMLDTLATSSTTSSTNIHVETMTPLSTTVQWKEETVTLGIMSIVRMLLVMEN